MWNWPVTLDTGSLCLKKVGVLEATTAVPVAAVVTQEGSICGGL